MIVVCSREYIDGALPDFLEIRNWLAVNCIGEYCYTGVRYHSRNNEPYKIRNEFEFKNADDAMRFKLVWG
jgi:hypothetical protein